MRELYRPIPDNGNFNFKKNKRELNIPKILFGFHEFSPSFFHAHCELAATSCTNPFKRPCEEDHLAIECCVALASVDDIAIANLYMCSGTWFASFTKPDSPEWQDLCTVHREKYKQEFTYNPLQRITAKGFLLEIPRENFVTVHTVALLDIQKGTISRELEPLAYVPEQLLLRSESIYNLPSDVRGL
jgi:hypothetical protein